MTTAATETDERLLRDLWPVEVYAPGHAEAVQRRCRAFVTTERLIVWTEEDRKPVLLVDEAITGGDPVGRDRQTFHGQLHVETASGPVHLAKTGGCGCGSSLKALSRPVPW